MVRFSALMLSQSRENMINSSLSKIQLAILYAAARSLSFSGNAFEAIEDCLGDLQKPETLRMAALCFGGMWEYSIFLDLPGCQ